MRKFEIREELNRPEYIEDTKRIQSILYDEEYIATLLQCENIWQKYSDLMCAGWMKLPEKDKEVFDCIEYYIAN